MLYIILHFVQYFTKHIVTILSNLISNTFANIFVSNVFNKKNFVNYVLYFTCFIIGQSFSVWGAYVTLPFKDLSYWQALKWIMPFVWFDWFFMTIAIDIGHTNNLVTPTQNTFLLILTQFTLVLLVNQYYLKQTVYLSDFIGFFIVLLGYFVSLFHIVSNISNVSLPKHEDIQQVIK
jgi:hypothetical protein